MCLFVINETESKKPDRLIAGQLYGKQQKSIHEDVRGRNVLEIHITKKNNKIIENKKYFVIYNRFDF